jgi:hypothetical protein
VAVARLQDDTEPVPQASYDRHALRLRLKYCSTTSGPWYLHGSAGASLRRTSDRVGRTISIPDRWDSSRRHVAFVSNRVRYSSPPSSLIFSDHRRGSARPSASVSSCRPDALDQAAVARRQRLATLDGHGSVVHSNVDDCHVDRRFAGELVAVAARWRHDRALGFQAPVDNRSARQGRNGRRTDAAKRRRGLDRKTCHDGREHRAFQ